MIALLVGCGTTAESRPPPLTHVGDTGPDEDGDGHTTTGTGGDDCNDADPLTFAGATEWCDDVDQDCDGAALAPGSCGLVQPFSTRLYEFNPESIPYIYAVRDVTGDGLDDVLGANSDGTVGITSVTGDIAGLAEWNWIQQWVPTFQRPRYPPSIEVGDIDGDGFRDVAIEDPLCVEGVVIAWGPIDTSAASGTLTEWAGPTADYTWTVLRAADVNGDGSSDLLRVPRVDGERTLEVFLGGSRRTGLGFVALETSQEVASDRAGDIDGDGADEVIVAPSPGTASWLSLAGTASGVWSTQSDLIGGTFADDATWESVGGQAPTWLPVGDWSGDGHDDVVLVAHGRGKGDSGYLLYFDDLNQPEVHASGVVENDVSLTSAPHFGGDEGMTWHDEQPAAILVGSGFTTASVIVVPSTWVEGTWLLSEVDHFSIGEPVSNSEEDISAVPLPWGRGDLDGDGWSDVLARADNSATGQDGAWIFRPFDNIPWDDPTSW